jgi:hypothetical protein
VRKIAVLSIALLLSLLTVNAHADVAAIHADRLPQETAVLAALDDVQQLEPYCHSWTNNWQFPVAKDEVAIRLGKDLGFLTIALKNHPDNVELLLLTGLAARYAYNLDVSGSHEAAISALGQAQKLTPSDVRAPWFHATLLCQTNQSKTGAEEFLSIEGSHVWDQLPAAFWDDYMQCPMIAGLSAHVLRAADHLAKLNASSSEIRSVLTEAARKRYDPFDPNKEYEPKDVWQGVKNGDESEFTSTTCGVRLRAHSDWTIGRLAVSKGSCIAIFSTGHYQGTVHNLRPSVVLLVQQPKENETLLEFSKKYLKGSDFKPFTPARCPATECMAISGEQPEMYGEDGGGHGRLVFFQRDQPDFPGLVFEGPQELPKADGKVATTFYYHPGQIQQRIPGKLYYVVLLDTAASIEEPAMKDFDFFLENLNVE